MPKTNKRHGRKKQQPKKQQPPQAKPKTRRPRKAKKGPRSGKRTAYTTNGNEFLKVAFASPDAPNSTIIGVPVDAGNEPTIISKCNINKSDACKAGFDTYYVFAPTPAIAYWRCEVPIGTVPTVATPFYAYNYPTTPFRFPNLDQKEADNDSNFTKFRFAASSCELECFMNEMKWQGNVQVIRTQLAVNEAVVPLVAAGDFDYGVQYTLSGMDALVNLASGAAGVTPTGVAGNVFVGSIKDGFYSVAAQQNPTFAYVDVPNGVNNSYEVHAPISSTTVPGVNDHLMMKGALLGMDTMDTIIAKVSVPAGGDDQSVMLRRWSVIEYIPSAQSGFIEYATPPAEDDPLAMRMYREVAHKLPVAVIQKRNAGFWDWVLKTVRTVAGALSILPGEAGVIAKGVAAAASLI